VKPWRCLPSFSQPSQGEAMIHQSVKGCPYRVYCAFADDRGK
jgi:hypothetical protein